jgi:hypothetical protein
MLQPCSCSRRVRARGSVLRGRSRGASGRGGWELPNNFLDSSRLRLCVTCFSCVQLQPRTTRSASGRVPSEPASNTRYIIWFRFTQAISQFSDWPRVVAVTQGSSHRQAEERFAVSAWSPRHQSGARPRAGRTTRRVAGRRPPIRTDGGRTETRVLYPQGAGRIGADGGRRIGSRSRHSL